MAKGIFLKGKNWYVDYYANGCRMREMVGPNKELAEKVLMKRKIEVAEGRFLDIKKEKKIKFEDFADEYFEIYLNANNKSLDKSDYYNLKRLKVYFSGKYLHEINALSVEKFRLERSREVGPATTNRALARLKALFNKAIAWNKFEGINPVKGVKFLKESPGRLRFLEKEEITKLVENCNDYLKPIVVVALNTGMRRGEIFNLKWRDIDFKRDMIHLMKTKNGEKRETPMNEVVKATLIKVRKHPESPYIFCEKSGLPFKNLRKSFFTACRKSDITNFRFHDLRHTFASQLVMSGVDLNTVRELLGHKSLEMTLRYSHLSPDHKKRAVDILGTRMDTVWPPEQIEQKSIENSNLVSVLNAVS